MGEWEKEKKKDIDRERKVLGKRYIIFAIWFNRLESAEAHWGRIYIPQHVERETCTCFNFILSWGTHSCCSQFGLSSALIHICRTSYDIYVIVFSFVFSRTLLRASCAHVQIETNTFSLKLCQVFIYRTKWQKKSDHGRSDSITLTHSGRRQSPTKS